MPLLPTPGGGASTAGLFAATGPAASSLLLVLEKLPPLSELEKQEPDDLSIIGLFLNPAKFQTALRAYRRLFIVLS
jgi:hypothetical protein